MKILSIESPHQLQDDRVKASIVVSEDDLIPLVQLMKDAKKGKHIQLHEERPDEIPQDYYFNLASQITRDLAERLQAEFNRGVKQNEVVHESPERQADVVKAHDLINNRMDRY